MMAQEEKINLLGLDHATLRKWFAEIEEKPFRADQVIQWIHQKGVIEFDQMTNLSQSLREKLSFATCMHLPEVVMTQASKDGTHKWLLRLQDGNCIETVFIPEANRGTLCVSSQVGCALNCSFCATGKQGFNRNLASDEIIGQLWLAEHRLLPKKASKTVTNVVMMGMGEPLLNFDPVLQALNLMMHDFGYGLSKYRVTLSTSGLIPQMEKLKELSRVSLAVSLHAPNNALRNQLVPLNKKYPLEQLIPVCRRYFEAEPKRCVTFEYVMLKGVNDTPAHAKELIALLKNVPCKLNLIPFNPFALSEYACSDQATIEFFQQMTSKAGINTTVRRERGGDISAACGQLEGDIVDRTSRRVKWLNKHEAPLKARSN